MSHGSGGDSSADPNLTQDSSSNSGGTGTGTLALQGFVAEKLHNQSIAVTGGTGAYNGARGTAVANQTNNSTTNITVTLLP